MVNYNEEDLAEKAKVMDTPEGLVHLHLIAMGSRAVWIITTKLNNVKLCGTDRCRPVWVSTWQVE